jgi:dihydrofolate synthase / folylpolyglutamate synthase
LALSAIVLLGQRDKFPINDKVIRKTLKKNVILGKMETIRLQKKVIILDGAHNPQKMKTFIQSLKKVYPSTKFSFLIAFKKGKDYKKILAHIAPEAKNIILTTFKITDQDLLHLSENPKIVADNLKKLAFSNYEIITNASLAFEKLLKKSSDTLIITGSIYLLSKIYPLIKKLKTRN